MNVKCTLDSEVVYIVGVSPSGVSDTVLITYVDSGNVVKVKQVTLTSNDIIADTVTHIDGNAI